MSDDLQPWERQPAEGARAFAAFCVYRDLGPMERSTRLAAEKVGRSKSQIAHLSMKFRWPRRVAAYDKWCDQVRLAKQRKALEEMGERHAGIAMLVQTKALEKFQSMGGRDLSPQTAITMFDVGVRVERLARGMATQSTEITGKDGGPIEIGEAYERLKDLIRRVKLERV